MTERNRMSVSETKITMPGTLANQTVFSEREIKQITEAVDSGRMSIDEVERWEKTRQRLMRNTGMTAVDRVVDGIKDGKRYFSAPSPRDNATENFQIPKIARPSEPFVDVYRAEHDAQLEALGKDDRTEPIPIFVDVELGRGNGYVNVLDKINQIVEDVPVNHQRHPDYGYIRRVQAGLREALALLPTNENVEAVYGMIDELHDIVQSQDGSVFHRNLGNVVRELERLIDA